MITKPVARTTAMIGVTEHDEGLVVKLVEYGNGVITVRAANQAGHDHTEVDLAQLVTWLRKHRPELLHLHSEATTQP